MQLPFTFIKIPKENEPRIVYNKNKLFYHVEQNMITNLTKSAFHHCGLNITNGDNWIASWGKTIEFEEYKKLKSYQKVNHFAGSLYIGRKDELHRRIKELKENGVNTSFYPESYLLFDDYGKLVNQWMKKKVWIVKPPALSRGRGIKLCLSDNLPPDEEGLLIQEYISKPLLINDKKFDLRIYILVPSISPLRIYMYNTGLAKFCTHKYNENGEFNDNRVHLTNFSLNKEDENYVKADIHNESITNSKCSLEFLLNYLKVEMNCNTDKIMSDIEDICISTLIAASNHMRPIQRRYAHYRNSAYELFGVDILIDENFKVYLMEFNISPSLSGNNSEFDNSLKFKLNLDVLRMARLIRADMRDPTHHNPCPGIEIYDNLFYSSITPERKIAVESHQINPWNDPVFADFAIIRDYIEEMEIDSNFRLIYPKSDTIDKYKDCFGKLQSYEDIVLGEWVKMDSENKLIIFKSKVSIYANSIQPMKEQIKKLRQEELKKKKEQQNCIPEQIPNAQTILKPPNNSKKTCQRSNSLPQIPRSSFYNLLM